ncbi:MAG: 2-hydroxyacyl-CoA dehydratase family protein [Verrucomicrobiota bacterium]
MDVLLTSPWLPAEWIAAHDLAPRGVWALNPPEAVALKAGVCAFAQGALQWAGAGAEGAAVFASSCDQLRRAADEVAARNAARTFLFNLPATWQTAAARQMYRAEVARLGRFLVALGGSAPTPEKLAQTFAAYQRARQQLLAAQPACAARAWAEAVVRFHAGDPVNALEPSAPADPRRAAAGVPVALVGGPMLPAYFNLLDALEAAGGRVVLNATEAGERSLLAPAPADAPVLSRDALADFYLDRCADVFQRPNTRLYAWLRERLAARAVRGLVLWSYFACDLWRAELQSLREAFDLPVLLIEPDAMHGDSPRLHTRLQAFVEMLQ